LKQAGLNSSFVPGNTVNLNFFTMTSEKINWAIDPVHTRLRFEAKYLLISTVSGWFRELEGSVISQNENFNDSQIKLTIYTHSLYTGIEERDNHLRSADFFDADRYPTITFQSTQVQAEGDTIYIKGNLIIKNITQEISLVAKYLGSVTDPMGNRKAGFEMDAEFDRKDFDITWNQFFDKQGVLISDKVKLHADLQLLQLP
jgi:polyisoprenoid-binding protein YceI